MNCRHLILIAALVSVLVAVGAPQNSAAGDDEFLSLLGVKEVEAPAPTVAPEAAAPVMRKVLTTQIGKLKPEQTQFVQAYEKGEWEVALARFSSSFDGTEFGKSATGRALRALVLFQNGIRVYALESLLSIETPSQISKDLLKLWREAAPETHPAWSFVNTALWRPSWAEALGPNIEIRLRGRNTYGPDQVDVVKELIRKAPAGTKERAWLEWQLLLAQSTGKSKEDSAASAKSLAQLMKTERNPVSDDLMTLTAARLLYQNGFLDAAIKYYEKVPKTSEDWFDAQEEMAWAFIRKGEPQDTIAITKTLAQPIFTAQVGPEAIFLRALALLKVCDYPQVASTLEVFRDRYRTRAKALMDLAANGDTPAVQKYIAKAKTSLVRLGDLRGDAAFLPRFTTRDEVLKQSVQTEAAFESEGHKLAQLVERNGAVKAKSKSEYQSLQKAIEARATAARVASAARVKALAQDEIEEIRQTLQKLQVIEAEVIQQVALVDQIKASKAGSKLIKLKGSTGAKSADRVWFPEENEVWFDELANYQVDLKGGCQAVKR